jgi:short-subunit dehydrogenase
MVKHECTDYTLDIRVRNGQTISERLMKLELDALGIRLGPRSLEHIRIAVNPDQGRARAGAGQRKRHRSGTTAEIQDPHRSRAVAGHPLYEAWAPPALAHRCSIDRVIERREVGTTSRWDVSVAHVAAKSRSLHQTARTRYRLGMLEQTDRSPITALITGASSGIGEATARRLAREPHVRLVLVARREDRLRRLAETLTAPTSILPIDLTDDDAPTRVLEHVRAHHERLTLLVNNAGASWRATFAQGGYENVRRTMELNFDAVVRLTEAFLPMLRASQPSAIVNVSSTAARVARPGAGAYSASKFALTGWSDALYAEERPHGVHVGLVLPGFVATEGFPATELTARLATRWIVSTPERAAEAVVDAGLRGRAERYVPRPYALAGILRLLAPGILRHMLSSGRGALLTTRTGAEAQQERL